MRILLSIKLCVALFMILGHTAWAQMDSLKSYTTMAVTGEPPRIDGEGNDPAWALVPWGGGDFRQNMPDAGAPASVQTTFKILYDAKNLYILIKNYDPEPSRIVRRMSRRDSFDGDFCEVNIDSYYDKRSAFSFTASVSGVKSDEYVSNDGNNWDASWDPIWYLQTSIDHEGWIAEMRIPLSQLRFADKPEHVWGIQFTRFFFRNQERSNWQYIAPNAGGWVRFFADLKGLKGIKPQKQVEVQPYILAKTETFAKEEGNPFVTGKSSGVDIGLDAKIGITSDVTLDLTVNPDFGQVEADPSQVNLSAFRLFFQERRPFFIEGNNTLEFSVVDFNSNKLFYSRRIGRTPQGEVDTDASGEDNVNEYVKTRANTRLLGAAKLTGKNKHGFSWGILESVTALEHAEIDSLGHRRKQVVEPLTNYFVARAQQDINKGNSVVGGMFTATNRKLDDPGLMWLHENAYSGGVDLLHHWKERTYYVSVKGLFSHVNGSPEAIKNTQEASERYFQRPDHDHAVVNPSRKSLTGTGGAFILGKRSGKLIGEMGYTWTSPEFELNDIGFLSQTDQMLQWIWMQYRIQKPFSIYRSMSIDAVEWIQWDFGRNNLAKGYELNGQTQFKNFWSLGMGGQLETHGISNADLRGGPALRYPGNTNLWVRLGSDERKKLHVVVRYQIRQGFDNYFTNTNTDLTINYRPMNAWSISIAPSIGTNRNQMQYVCTGEAGSEKRYVVAQIDQSIARVTIRSTFMITPNLSLQYWGQPFGTAGKYTKFKYIKEANAEEYANRFDLLPTHWLLANGDQYMVDEDGDGHSEFKFNKPDFSVGQFRSNMVLRWEYIPGSTFFLVWTQEMNGGFTEHEGNRLHQRYSFSFDEKAHNIFLMKYTYRFRT